MTYTQNQTAPNNINQSGNLDELLNIAVRDIVKAQHELAMSQMNLILESCFKKNGDTYESITIDLAIISNDTPGLPANTTETENIVNLPLLKIMPLSSLNVDKVTLDFDLDINMAGNNNMPQFMVKTIEIPRGNIKANITAEKGSASNRVKLTVELGQLPLNDTDAIIAAFTKKGSY